MCLLRVIVGGGVLCVLCVGACSECVWWCVCVLSCDSVVSCVCLGVHGCVCGSQVFGHTLENRDTRTTQHCHMKAHTHTLTDKAHTHQNTARKNITHPFGCEQNHNRIEKKKNTC